MADTVSQTVSAVEHIASTLRKYRFRFNSEAELQEGIAGVFTLNGIAFVREYRIDTKSRLDFMADGIAVETKTAKSRADLIRQIHRYAQCQDVTGIVVVSAKARHATLPDTISGKPVRAVFIGGAF